MKNSTESALHRITHSRATERVLLVLGFTALTALAAQVRIPLPITPVPMTLQTLVLFASICYLDAKEASVAQGAYLLAGALGLPVFAGAVGGLAVLSGPTCGYLIGFVLAAYAMGWLKARSKVGPVPLGGIFMLGATIVFVCGTLGLVLVFRQPLGASLAMGVFPFVFGDTLKAIAATQLGRLAKR